MSNFKKGEKRTRELGAKGGKKSKRPTSITKAMRALIEDGTVCADDIAKAMLALAKKNPQMTKLVLDRLDGKVVEKIQTESVVVHVDSKELKQIRQDMLENDDV